MLFLVYKHLAGEERAHCCVVFLLPSTRVDPESFDRGGPTSTCFFFFFFISLTKGGRIQIPLLAGHFA